MRARASRGLTLFLAVGLVAAACSGDDKLSETGDTVAEPQVTTASPPNPPAEFSVGAALDAINSYFDAYAAADVDAARPLLAPDATMRDPLGVGNALENVAIWGAWDQAQRTEISNRECTPGDGMAVTCSYEEQQYVRAVVAAPPVTYTTTFEFEPNGLIASIHDVFSVSDYAAVGGPFDDWMRENHFDDLSRTTCCGWVSGEAAAEHGATRVAYADRWVSFALDAVDQTFRLHNGGDLAGFLDRFAPDVSILGASAEDAPAIFGALMAADSQYELSGCVAAGTSVAGLSVRCDAETTNLLSRSGGVVLSGALTMTVGPEGVIRDMTTAIGFGPAFAFGDAFNSWLAETYPDTHAAIEWISPSLPAAGSVGTALEFVEEFVDASETYPLSG